MMTSASQTKTVLHIFSGDLWAGAEVVVFNLLNELKTYSELEIIALSLNEGILTEKLQNIGVETYIIPEAKYSFPRIFLEAFLLLRGKKVDIIHTHRYKENLLALLLTSLIGVRQLICTMHGLPEPQLYGENDKTSVSWKKKIDYCILSHFFTRVVAVSQEMKNTLVEKYHFRQEKVDVIYNGIPIPSTNQPINQSTNDRFHIGTVGRMVPVKDFNLFLEVAAEIKKRTDKVRFSILGDGPLKEQLIQKAKDLHIEGHTQFVSPSPDPFPYYQSLDLYLNTSLHEGIPLSILEAMACGKPVVAAKVGGLPEIMPNGKDGVLIEGREPTDFVSACLRLMSDKELRIAIGQNSSSRIRSDFGSFRMAESYRQLYKR